MYSHQVFFNPSITLLQSKTEKYSAQPKKTYKCLKKGTLCTLDSERNTVDTLKD